MWRTWISLKSKGHKVSPDVVQHKLYVNILMSTQINEVRGLLGDLPMEMPKFLSDATIRRFLQARNWSTVHAAKSLKEAASWRRQYKPEKICWENIADSENEARRAYIPDYLDKNGRMVFITLPTIKVFLALTKIKYKEIWDASMHVYCCNNLKAWGEYILWEIAVRHGHGCL